VKVLVSYATRHGATRGIAERIARTLEQDGLGVALRPVEQAGSVDAFDAVVIGGAAYNFHWMKEASAFVHRHRAILSTRPTWLFSCGPTGTPPSEEKRQETLRSSIPREFAEIATALHPRGQRVFYGAYDPDAAPIGLAEGLFAKMTARWPSIKEGIPAGDFRDWAEIEVWAHDIARELQPVGVGA
jgi:menaquinone-dependent protoporphyrinogen oxidase